MALSRNAPAIIVCLSDTSVGELSFSLVPRRQLTSSRRHRVGGFRVTVSFVSLSVALSKQAVIASWTWAGGSPGRLLRLNKYCQ